MIRPLAFLVSGAALLLAQAPVPPATPAGPPPMEISRPARTWEYMDAVGPQAAIFGNEAGTVEAWVYPLKLFRDFRLLFRIGERVIPGPSIARRIISRPGVYSVVYTGDEFQVTETFIAPVDQPGILVRIEAQTSAPVEIRGTLVRDFQLMWPASIGSPYIAWDAGDHRYRFGADGTPYAAVMTSPDLAAVDSEYLSNYGNARDTLFSLGTVKGQAVRYLAIAGSIKSVDEAAAKATALMRNPGGQAESTIAYYQKYLDSTLNLELPDKQLERAYNWARVSVRQAMVKNPFLGEGLVAGFGPSKGVYRPGFAWFFGRDSFWTTLAQTAAGDYASAKTAIEFIAKYQREDGKIPHEISQATAQVDWFKAFPYAHASADATSLFVIAVRDYTESSGDPSLMNELWSRLEKAIAFQRATADEAGFPKNFGVGHGWVEGGPLLPIRTEFYQAGLHVEALRSMGVLARIKGDRALAAQLENEASQKRQQLQDLYWQPAANVYAFAIGQDGHPVPRASVLATVPMWFGLTDPKSSRAMIRQLADEEHASDWGMRILSRKSDLYDPSGYHFGSVWPLFTGWAAVGEYRYHQPYAGFANLKANSWLALDGPGGHTPEVLSGQTYSPLSTGSPHQTWSAAMIMSPLIRGLLGLEVDRTSNSVSLTPHLPASWDGFSANGMGLAFTLRRSDRQLTLEFDSAGMGLKFAPAFPPVTQLTAAELNGAPIEWRREDGGTDWHAVIQVPAGTGKRTLTLRYRYSFGLSIVVPPPRLAETSRNLKILSEEWTGRSLDLTLSGIPGRVYRFDLYGDSKVAGVIGATLLADARSIRVVIPGEGTEYRQHSIRILLAEATPAAKGK